MDINVTLLIQLINFVVILVLVNAVLIRPVREMIHKRKAARYDLIRRAHAFTDQASEDADKYEQTLRSAREEGARIRQQLRNEGLADQAGLLASAGAEAAELLNQERERALREAEQAKKALSSQVASLADDVAARLLA